MAQRSRICRHRAGKLHARRWAGPNDGSKGQLAIGGIMLEVAEVAAPTIEELEALLLKIITRVMRLLTRQGFLIEEQGMTYLAEVDKDPVLTPLRTASCTYRIALGPRAGQKVLSLQSLPSQARPSAPDLRANAHGFSLHAAVRWGADQRADLEHLCRYITRPAIANERLKR